MGLKSIRLRGFRNLHTQVFSPAPSRSWIAGDNGSGKSSLLEAVYFVANGRSFRAAGPTRMVSHDASEGFRIDSQYSHPDGLQSEVVARYDRHRLQFLVNSRLISSRSELNSLVPCRYLGPRVQELVSGPPKLRRAFLDWGLFHVKHFPTVHWRRYRKAVHQRIAALRSNAGARQLDGLEQEIVGVGCKISQARKAYLDELKLDQCENSRDFDLQFEYRDEFLESEIAFSILADNRERESRLGYQLAGPHRAELRIRSQGRSAKDNLSSGESKLSAITLLLAQFRQLTTMRPDVGLLLIDDLRAELGDRAQSLVLDRIEGLSSQVVLTGTRIDDKFVKPGDQMFHVEHGEIHPVV